MVQVDETLKLTEDSPQLSGLLHSSSGLQAKPAVAGQSLLEFFPREDQDRICKQLASSILHGGPVLALNVDFRDCDEDSLRVEAERGGRRNSMRHVTCLDISTNKTR